MAKRIMTAVNKPGFDVIIFPTTQSFRVSVDANRNGVLDELGSGNEDNWIAYNYDTNIRELRYCANMSFNNPINALGACDNGSWETLSRHVTSAMNSAKIIYSNSNNYVEINITACADPGSANPCGGMRNPSVNMKSSVIMPSVSTR
jgi:hypothetical protein